MKFFIPHAKDEKETQEVFEGIRKFAAQTLGWEITDKKIFSLRYTHKGKEFYAEVGKNEHQVGEEVIAILESNCFLVCTPTRGVIRGMPILVGTDGVCSITDFEE